MIPGLTNSEGIDVLERLTQFAAQRHRIIANNVANLSTPGFRPVDVDPRQFQAQLAQAVDARREGSPAANLALESSSQVEVDRHGLTLRPEPIAEGILFHDGSDHDVERIMQDLVENFMTFRMAAQLLRSRFDLLETAIRERL